MSGTALRAWRVVIIDDSPDDRAEARRLLLRGSDRRYTFVEAETGAAGVRAVLADPPDCVLLDYYLPDQDAPDVLAALAATDGLTVCPVVVVTGSAGADLGRAVLRVGAQDYIGKDWLTPESLTRAVENGAERWAMARESSDRLSALRARDRELQTLADNTPDILTRFDRELRHTFVNAAVEKATGRPRAEFIGQTNRDLGMRVELSDLWDTAILEVFETGQGRSIVFSVSGRAAPRHYAARLVPEHGPSGAVEGVLGVTQDVTDRTRFERDLADQENRKNEFLATLAHELRNPLVPLRNGLRVLRLGGDVRHAQDMMERQLGHLVRLVDDLLDIARINHGKITLARERLTIREAVDAAVEMCRPILDGKEHTLLVDLPVEELVVDGDRTRLTQVIANLLANSGKFCDPGGRISVTAHNDGGSALIVVCDTGHGIAPDALPGVWDMFNQVRDTVDKAQGGLGIGLSLVKKLVEMHDGSVTAESDGLGRGSTFTVRLPISAEAPHGGSASAQSEHEPVVRRVLIVDDNVDVADSLAMLLTIFGHETTVAYSGPEALTTARAFAPDVVFLDIGLPDGMDGYEVARRLRADPATAGLVLVALTGWGSDADKRRSSEAGFDHHLTKPADPEALEAVLAWPSPVA